MENYQENILFDTDSYKNAHGPLYRPRTKSIFSYIEARSGGLYKNLCYAGLQAELKRYYTGCVVTMDMVKEAKAFYPKHMNVDFAYDAWAYVAKDLGGRLPVRIRSIPEGTIVPERCPLLTVESTGPDFTAFIASWLEPKLLRPWGTTNVATLGWHIKRDFIRFWKKTSDAPVESLDFKLHDFGGRGVDSQESAQVAGLGHLFNFKGSDTVAAVRYANRMYHSEMSGFSIPASEHSTITSWGHINEVHAYENMLNVYGKPGAIFACVSDGKNIFDAVTNLWGTELRQKVIDSGATLVIRPDSGNPVFIVADVLQRLDAKFGHTVNSKGYKVLNNVRVIQGDGITHKMIVEILETITMLGFSIDNIAFGMGGALLRGHNRDTQKQAMKCSSVNADGENHDVYKDPITDHGKSSFKGRLDAAIDTDYSSEGWPTRVNVEQLDDDEIGAAGSILQTTFANGELLIDDSLETCRTRAAAGPIEGNVF